MEKVKINRKELSQNIMKKKYKEIENMKHEA